VVVFDGKKKDFSFTCSVDTLRCHPLFTYSVVSLCRSPLLNMLRTPCMKTTSIHVSVLLLNGSRD